jgi:dTDP-4-amino-4,6-dideoxygalactose transaminase
MPLPLFDCRLDPEAIGAMAPSLAAGQLAAGPHIALLEEALSARMGGRPVVALSDSTQAIEAALICAGVGPGSDVLTLSYNCMSSNSAITYAGAKPVWVDIDPQTAAMDVADAERAITPETQALLVYHAAGYPADLRAIRSLCEARGLTLVEDANNALGAKLSDGSAVGTVGDFAVFSFYANRQVNAIEGAGLVCPDEAVAHRVRAMRRFGIDQSRFRDADGEINSACDIPRIGLSATLPNTHAALAMHQLGLLDARLEQTRANAAAIGRALQEVAGLTLVQPAADGKSAYWALLLLCERRDLLMRGLKALGVGCSKLHQPNHQYSGFAAVARPLPQTAFFMERILAVPCGWWMGEGDCEMVAAAIREILA